MIQSARRVVIWDVDDVLNALMREWFDDFRTRSQASGPSSFTDLTANPPHQLFGLCETDYLQSLDDFRRARYDTLAPRTEALGWFERYGGSADHIALTAAPTSLAHLSAGWVIRHFGRWIRTFAFAPSPRGINAAPAASKADYLRWLGKGDVLVDDRQDNATAVRALGLDCVVVPQPWNRSEHRSLEAALEQVRALLG